MKDWATGLAYVICLIVFVYSNKLEACEDINYTVSIGSYHVKDHRFQQKFNENNIGIGVECDELQTGVYHNSIGNVSVYVGSVVPIHRQLGVKYGAVTGYQLPIAPYVAGYIRLYDRVELTILPPTIYNPLTIGYSLRW